MGNLPTGLVAPREHEPWRVVLPLLMSLSFLLLLIGKISYHDPTLPFLTQNTLSSAPSGQAPSFIVSPLYLLTVPLFLAYFFLPVLVRLPATDLSTSRGNIARRVRTICVWLGVGTFAVVAFSTSGDRWTYVPFYLGGTLLWGYIEYLWATPCVKPAPDLKTVADAGDRVELHRVMLELLRFEDQKWGRGFQYLWVFAIAVVVAGTISFASGQDPTNPLGRYAMTEDLFVFLAGMASVLPIALYSVKKSNAIHAEMERIGGLIRAEFESRANGTKARVATVENIPMTERSSPNVRSTRETGYPVTGEQSTDSADWRKNNRGSATS